jgi:YidC/Oxa1 family membrane protein insertase
VLYLISNPIDWISDGITKLLLFLGDSVATTVSLPEYLSPLAVAIILVGLLVKAATWPLNASQMRSMRSMQELQPKLRELQEKHKGEREKLAQAQMDLYREHGVNPFGGCLPLIIQMPVLFGLYRAIYDLGPAGSGELAGERFLWIRDLGLCEPSPLCMDPPGGPFGLPVPILLIIMTVAQMAYQKWMTPPSAANASDPTAQAMQSVFKWMPLMFAFIFATLPSGLVLYYTVFTVTNIVQQYTMKKSMPAVGAKADEVAASASAGENGIDDGANGPGDNQDTVQKATDMEEVRADERRKSRRESRRKRKRARRS